MPANALRWIVALGTAAFACAGLGAAAVWGPDGHKIVAQIAYDNLSAKTKAEVDKLLEGDTLPGVANWADDVWHAKAEYEHTRYWHYADMEKGEEEFSLAKDCPAKGCVVQAILDASSTLSDSHASKADRQEALKFLVHFAGDIHQPLHVGHKGDSGGNGIYVKLFGSSMTLHKVWDSGLIKHRGLSWTKYAQELESHIKDADKKKWQGVTDPADWATESHHLAEDNAYVTSAGAEIKNNDELDEHYYKDNIGVVDEQLTKAGLRLANTLNAIYDPEHAVGATPAPPAGGDAAPDVKFVGSRLSNVYHLPACKDVERIDADNLVEYSVAPPGKRLHKGCPR